MKKIKAIYYNSDNLFEDGVLYFDIPVEIHTTRFANNATITQNIPYKIPFENESNYKVYINCNEPESEIQNYRESIESVIEASNQYDLILTTDVRILQECKNAKLFPYGTTWLNKNKINHIDAIGEYDSTIDILNKGKKFEISFICTARRQDIRGYKIRREVWDNKSKIHTPTLFYSSQRKPIDFNSMIPIDDKSILFNSQFHIAIESHQVENYFTEKLIDSFITKTVPIYFGCPNIEDFFDIRGIIIVDDCDDIISKCNNLTKNTYDEMSEYIEYNYKEAKKYAKSFAQRVKEEIERNYIHEY
tara:strand:+ start:117 stop:1028 length:912 start_codon:yes stop_codon:yes gene_type:complete